MFPVLRRVNYEFLGLPKYCKSRETELHQPAIICEAKNEHIKYEGIEYKCTLRIYAFRIVTYEEYMANKLLQEEDIEEQIYD